MMSTNFFGIFDPIPLLVSAKFTQPPFLRSSHPPVLTSFVNARAPWVRSRRIRRPSFPLLHFSLRRCHRNSLITWLIHRARAHSKVISPYRTQVLEKYLLPLNNCILVLRPVKGGASSHVHLELIPSDTPQAQLQRAAAVQRRHCTRRRHWTRWDPSHRGRPLLDSARRMFVVRRLTPSRRTYMSAKRLTYHSCPSNAFRFIKQD